MTASVPASPPAEPSDCRSNEGIAVGLIDGIIAQARVVNRLRANLAQQPGANEALSEALADLRADEDVLALVAAQDTTLRAKIAGEIETQAATGSSGRCS